MMRWPWSKPNGEQDQRLAEAAESKHDAEAALDRARRRWPEVHAARRELEPLGAQIERAMRGRA